MRYPLYGELAWDSLLRQGLCVIYNAEGGAIMAQKTEDGKRFPMSFRTTAALRDKIGDAAAVSGRSVAQELEFRLEASFHSDERIGDLQDRIRELDALACN